MFDFMKLFTGSLCNHGAGTGGPTSSPSPSLKLRNSPRIFSPENVTVRSKKDAITTKLPNKTKYVAYSLFSINMIILKQPSYNFPLNQKRPLECTKIEAHVTSREISAHVACQAFIKCIKCSWRDLLEGIFTFFTSFLFSFCFFPCHLSNNIRPTSILSAWASIPCGPRCLLADPAFSKRWFCSLAAKKLPLSKKCRRFLEMRGKKSSINI